MISDHSAVMLVIFWQMQEEEAVVPLFIFCLKNVDIWQLLWLLMESWDLCNLNFPIKQYLFMVNTNVQLKCSVLETKKLDLSSTVYIIWDIHSISVGSK